jgi:beta-phosphoglucomutase-like phosphatase (HAD superfamily)
VPALELDTVAAKWQLALDAAQAAVSAAGNPLPGDELGRRRGELDRERRHTAELLTSLAQTAGVRPTPWLLPSQLTTDMLGLPIGVKACLFDLEGVLTDSARLHAWAWAQAFDSFLSRRSDQSGLYFVPFDLLADYRNYVDGRPRLEGVHAFLDSRGIRVPEGRPGDPPDADTAQGIADHKQAALMQGLAERGVNALAGARRYLEAAGHAGLMRAVVSASAHAAPVLELAGLTTVVDEQVDAAVIEGERLRARPAPDLLESACRKFDVPTEAVVTFTHSPAGIAAGNAAGSIVIGVGSDGEADVLRGFGAERVVPALVALLDRRLVSQ